MVKHKVSYLSILSFIFCLMIIVPSLEIIINLFKEPGQQWAHIQEYLLKDYAINTIIICIFTGVFTLVLGVGISWLISAYDFPLRRFFKWGLVLPLAIPPYIAAYTYSGILGYTGDLQTLLRSIGIQVDQRYFDIMSIGGAIFIFTIFLLPYVYMIVRSYLEKQSSSLVETARMLGESEIGLFFRVVLPISRVVIVSGITLVILEVISDYGVVSYFGVPTFSTAIFQSWFSMGDVDSAVRLSAILLVIVFSVISGEKFLRRRKRYSETNGKHRALKRKKLKGIGAILAFSLCFIVFFLGFLAPIIQLLKWAMLSYESVISPYFVELIYNTLWVSIVASVIIIIASLIIGNYTRLNNNAFSRLAGKITVFGYSVPGAVIAITVVVFFVDIDKGLGWLYSGIYSDGRTLVLSMSIIMLIFAYFIRYLAVGYQSIEGGFQKIGKRYYEASRLLGHSRFSTFINVDFPMMKPSIIAGLALVFVDIVKELPLVLLLRPFNFNTLATKVFEYANDEMMMEASIPSLLIIGVSFIAIIVLYKVGDKEDNHA
ncbi:MAG: iron ABC transporter permease [Clostridium sp.]